MTRRGLLFILCGPSGVGKTTLAHHLLEHHPTLTFSVSYTTRAARPTEVDGADYHFVDLAAFEQMRVENQFAEYANVHGNFYGTAVRTIEQAWEAGHDVIFDIDYQGAAQLQQRFDEETVSVLVTPPSLQALDERLRRRNTDDETVIARRLANAQHELAQWRLYDFVIENDALEHACQQADAIYTASRCRTFLHERRLESEFG